MFVPAQLHDYQRKAILHQLYHDDSMLWLDMGLGKTVITLSTIEHRMRAGQVRKTLIFGPVRVIHAVWAREAAKWSHVRDLRFSVAHGSERERIRALNINADIYLCNYENMAWLANYLLDTYIHKGKPIPFDMIVYDEVTKVKKSTSKRVAGGQKKVPAKYKMTPFAGGNGMKKLMERTGWDENRVVEMGYARLLVPEHKVHYDGWRQLIDHFKYRTGLTGTPAPNGYLDLHGQFLVVDGGERLTEYISHYRDAYFVKSFCGWGYEPSDPGKAWIEHKIADITIKMDAKDYLDLPPVTVNNLMVDIPASLRPQYDQIEADMFTRLDTGTEVEVFNKASVANKCLQFCNGAVFTDSELKTWEPVHDAKLDALEDVMEEANGKPVLVGYNFTPDAERIMKRFKAYKPVKLADIAPSKMPKLIRDWNSGRIKMLIGHPASMGHGVDGLQDTGHIMVLFGLNWDMELYIQFRKRLDRQGQTHPIMLHQILCNDSYDLVVLDTLRRKRDDEDGLKDSIDRYRQGKLAGDGELSFL